MFRSLLIATFGALITIASIGTTALDRADATPMTRIA